jgi:hypothetical protein
MGAPSQITKSQYNAASIHPQEIRSTAPRMRRINADIDFKLPPTIGKTINRDERLADACKNFDTMSDLTLTQK